jgi:hypothetical protein
MQKLETQTERWHSCHAVHATSTQNAAFFYPKWVHGTDALKSADGEAESLRTQLEDAHARKSREAYGVHVDLIKPDGSVSQQTVTFSTNAFGSQLQAYTPKYPSPTKLTANLTTPLPPPRMKLPSTPYNTVLSAIAPITSSGPTASEMKQLASSKSARPKTKIDNAAIAGAVEKVDGGWRCTLCSSRQVYKYLGKARIHIESMHWGGVLGEEEDEDDDDVVDDMLSSSFAAPAPTKRKAPAHRDAAASKRAKSSGGGAKAEAVPSYTIESLTIEWTKQMTATMGVSTPVTVDGVEFFLPLSWVHYARQMIDDVIKKNNITGSLHDSKALCQQQLDSAVTNYINTQVQAAIQTHQQSQQTSSSASSSKASKDKQQFPCSVAGCGKVYQSRSSLTHHMKSKHGAGTGAEAGAGGAESDQQSMADMGGSGGAGGVEQS